MPGLGPGIHVLLLSEKGADGRDAPGHDTLHFLWIAQAKSPLRLSRTESGITAIWP